jgi:hypothetical protein
LIKYIPKRRAGLYESAQSRMVAGLAVNAFASGLDHPRWGLGRKGGTRPEKNLDIESPGGVTSETQALWTPQILRNARALTPID